MKKISVIMSVYNEPEEYLQESIQSILNQSYDDIEFVIVLDNPDNSTAKNLLHEYKMADKRIRLLYNHENIGLAGSLNRALNAASGEYIARMDADDISEYRRLACELEFLQSEKLDLVGCQIQCISETGGKVGEPRDINYPPECISEILLHDDCVPHPTWLGKRTVFETLHGYKEDMFTAQDYDFLLRALNRGFRIGVCGDVLLRYRINTRGISSSNYLRQLLTGEYLQKNFARLDEVNQAEINRALADRLTEKATQRYVLAKACLNEGISLIKRHKLLGVLYAVESVLISPYVIHNIKKIIAMKRIKRKHSR